MLIRGLLNQQHPFNRGEIGRDHPVKINAAGQMTSIVFEYFISGGIMIKTEAFYFFSNRVINFDSHISGRRNMIVYGGNRVKWIRVVLFEDKPIRFVTIAVIISYGCQFSANANIIYKKFLSSD